MRAAAAYVPWAYSLASVYFIRFPGIEYIQYFPNPTLPLTQEIEEKLSLLAREGMKIQRPREVVDYLLVHPELGIILQLAVQAVKKHFESPELILSVYEDPEVEDRHLQLCIRLDEYDESFLERMRAVGKEVIRHLAGTKGWLALTTDFKKKENAL